MKFIIIGIFFFVIFLVILFWIKKKRAIQKVKCSSEIEKVTMVNKILKKFGFCMDVKQDIVISLENSWQKNFGYSNFYDLKATSFNMVFDAEPILFEYQDKEYRLEFWKGQYGISTGAEIGLYVHDYSNRKEGIYRAARPDEYLPMGFLLFKKCFLFAREDCGWWLTGFDVGRFSKPKDLKLKVFIQFPNQEMLYAFVKGLLKAGYTENRISVQNTCVYFEICEAKNYRVNKGKIKKFFKQIKNRINCALFRYFTRYFPKTLDKLAFICFLFPHLYILIIKFCLPRKKCRKCKKS